MSMKLLTLSLATIARADPSITIKQNGAAKNVFVTGTNNGLGDGLMLGHNGRSYLTNTNGNGGFSPNMYYKPNLLGGTYEYDMDLS